MGLLSWAAALARAPTSSTVIVDKLEDLIICEAVYLWRTVLLTHFPLFHFTLVDGTVHMVWEVVVD